MTWGIGTDNVAERMLGWEWSNSKAHIFHEVVFLEQIKERIDMCCCNLHQLFFIKKKKIATTILKQRQSCLTTKLVVVLDYKFTQ